MKRLTKYPTGSIVIAMIISLSVLRSIDASPSMNLAWMMGYPIQLLIDVLRAMSTSSTVNNLVAWVIFIVITTLPTVVGWLWLKKAKISKITFVLLALFSLTLLFTLYGLLNHWFMHPILSFNLAEYMPVIYFIVTILLLTILIGIWISHIITYSKQKNELIQNFQIVLLISGLAFSFLVALLIASLPQLRSTESSNIMLIFSSVTSLIPLTLMIVLIIKLIHFLELMKKQLFTATLISPLKGIRTLSIWLVSLSIFLPVFLGLTQLILIEYLENVNIQLQVPWIELIVAFIILLMSELIIQGIKTTAENEQFI